MKFINNWSVRSKILLIPLLGSIGFVMYLIFNTMTMKNSVDLLDNAQNVRFPLLQKSEKSLVLLSKIKDVLSNAVILGEAELLSEAGVLAKSMISGLDEINNADKKTMAEIDVIKEQFNAYYNEASSISSNMVDGTADFSNLAKRSESMSALLLELQTSLNSFQVEQMSLFTGAFEAVGEKVNTTISTGIIVGIVTIIILFTIGLTVGNTICSNLNKVVSSFKGLAKDDGDLRIRMVSSSNDEIGELTEWFNSFIDKLQSVIKQVVDISNPLSEASLKVKLLSEESKSNADTQNESVSLSLMSVNEMSQSVSSITVNAADAADAAKKANEDAEKGRGVVELTISEIESLSSMVLETSESILKLQGDTEQVNQVLEVIKGIADQTNLLALNAAIEAARAGEQGRGFAVVADEVRNLASRTQDSTKEINEIMEKLQSGAKSAVENMGNSKLKVESAVSSANDAGKSLLMITDSVNVISDMNNQIAVATEEQHQISTLMVENVESIKLSAEKTSHSSTEMYSVSDDLSGLIIQQENITKLFKV
jgi:methyl-accepting chemotaxis protein